MSDLLRELDRFLNDSDNENFSDENPNNESGFEIDLASRVPFLIQKAEEQHDHDLIDTSRANNYNNDELSKLHKSSKPLRKIIITQIQGGNRKENYSDDTLSYENIQNNSRFECFKNNEISDKTPLHAGYTTNNDKDSLNSSSKDFKEPQKKKSRENPTGNHDPSFSPKRITINQPHEPNCSPIENGVKLLPVCEIFRQFNNYKLASVFAFDHFNSMQSMCFDDLFNTTTNCVVSSPTGSGKTVLFELAILKLYQNTGFKVKSTMRNSKVDDSFKAIYIAPTKSLCAERAQDWARKFHILGLSCQALTGDTTLDELGAVKQANIIMTTPEKWDLITRKWTDYKRLISIVQLFMIDEIHTLRNDRGAVLEVIVSRMKTITQNNVRFVALSATVPNIDDVAVWLTRDKNHPNLPAITHTFGEEFRPVKLSRFVYGYTKGANGNNSYVNDFQMDKVYSNKLPELIKKHGEFKPILIFCSTRKIAISTAKFLANYHNLPSALSGSRLWRKPDDNSFNFKDNELDSFAKAGVLFHHAGLDFQDRQMVERCFILGKISIICCTSTLAVGINLPANLVIIKGTKSWANNKLSEYNELEVIQMIGRAGRPQFGTMGTAIIMTTNDKRMLYEHLIRGTHAIESCLHLNLVEHLVAEVSLGTITSIRLAIIWLKSTFLYIRLQKNPTLYINIVSAEAAVTSTTLDQSIEAFCRDRIEDLIRAKLIKLQVETDSDSLVCTNYGTSMSQYYVKYETMKYIVNVDSETINEGTPLLLNDVLTLLSKSAEFKEYKLKHTEKKLYKYLNKANEIRFPIKSALIKEDWEKISLLIQTELGGVEYLQYEGAQKHFNGYTTNKFLIFKHALRILSCIIDCLLQRTDSDSVKSALELYRSIHGKSWQDHPLVLRQLEGIGLAAVRKLVSHNIRTLSDLRGLENNKIEYFLGINPGRGAKVKKDLEGVPHFSIAVQQLSVSSPQSINGDSTKVPHLDVTIGIKAQYLNNPVVPFWHGERMNAIVLTETSDGSLLDFRRTSVAKLQSAREFKIKAAITNPGQAIKCHIYCETVIGVEESCQLILNIPTSYFLNVVKPEPKIRISEEVIHNLESNDSANKPIVNYFQSRSNKENKENNKFLGKNEPPRIEPKVNLRKNTEELKFEFNFDNLDASVFSVINARNTNTNHDKAFKGPSFTPPPKNNAKINLKSVVKSPNSLYFSTPRQRPDGKWDCNHICRDKSACRHICCNKGLDQPPKSRKTVLLDSYPTVGPFQPKLKPPMEIDSSFDISDESSMNDNILSYRTDIDVDINTATEPISISTSTPSKRLSRPRLPTEVRVKLGIPPAIKKFKSYSIIHSDSDSEIDSESESKLNFGLESKLSNKPNEKSNTGDGPVNGRFIKPTVTSTEENESPTDSGMISWEESIIPLAANPFKEKVVHIEAENAEISNEGVMNMSPLIIEQESVEGVNDELIKVLGPYIKIA